MPANFSVQFIVNEKTQSRVLKLTDASSGFTLAKGNFSITFPDGSTRIKTDFTSPDISAPLANISIPAVLDTNNNVITGTYKIDFVALDASNTSYSSSKSFDFNWVKPSNGITNLSDVLIPEVKYQDTTSYSPIGSFTGSVTRTLSASFPTTSEASGGSVSTVSSNLIDMVSSGKYYDGTYTPTSDVLVNYTHSSNSWLTISYIELFTKTFLIKRCPTQIDLINKINTYRGVIEAYKEKNDTQFNILSEQYDLAIALYSHVIARYETSTQDGSEGQLRELLSILEPYSTSYTPQLTRMLPFELASTGSNSFSISDGTNTDQIPLGSILTLSSGNPALTIGVSNNLVTYTPTFGTAINTFAQGNDSRFHSAVTIGTANGLSLASQALSLAAATSSSSGAMSAADKAKLDGIAAGANTGTVTSIGISVPSAFTVSNSPVTTSGTINISATGNPLQYITGAGALATLNTGAVPESGNLYFTNTRSRSAISVSGSLSYDSGTGVISYTTPSETDPVFTASAAFGISSTNISNWNTAYGWGNHASAGYLTSSLASTTYQPLDADLTAIAGLTGTSGLLKKTSANTWSLDTNTYLTSFTETDPIFVASAAYGITNTNISNWNTAYGWGNHASAGYLTSINSSQITTALGYTPENAANKGIANGYASLDGAGLVPSTQLPSYVDDVLEYADLASLPATGATGKIYVTLDTNKIYRWSGTVYVEISSSAGGGGTWGSIIGALSNQTDLQAALDAKQNSLGFTPVTNARTLTINGVTYDLTANRSWTVSGTMPAGGAAGQILSKIDATDYNTQWIDNYAEQVKHSVKLGATIAKGKAVYVSGADGTNMIVSAASNASEATSSKVLGLLETGGVTNDIVKVVTEGLVAGLDTSTATAGDPVWLGTGGNLIFGLANKPVAPANLVFIGVVTRVQSNNGEIFVNVQNGFELDELHNVLLTSEANKDLIYYDNATSLWKNAQLSTVLGYTPANDSAVVHIAGAETITGTKTFRGSSTNETPTLGANILSSSGWATGVTGWTGDYTNGWTVVGSGSSPMTNTQTAVSNTFYVLSVTATTSVSGKYLSITFGGGSFFAYFASTGTQTVNVEGLTTSTGTLSISASGFDGTISAISFKTRNSTSLPIATFASSTGLNPIDVRADNVSSSNNMFIGFDAGKSVYLTANSNLGIGYNVLKTLQNGIQNIGIGSSALNASITGSGNIGIGVQALSSSISGQFNIAIGTIALSYNKASYNVAIGSSAAYNNTTGTYNVALGFNTMYGASSSTAAYNTALGAETLYNIASNSNNVAVGYRSLYSLAGSNGNNVSIGYQAGRYISGGSTAATDIANSIFIGHSAYPLANAQTNQIVIGHATVGNGSNTVTIGNSSITANYFRGSINGGSFVKSGGTSSQFLKADGSVDSSTYLTSFTETDPIYIASSWYTTTNNASNWDTAYGWGNHASAGYLTTSTAASAYQPLDADLTAIAGLAGTSGFLKKTAANTWSLDTSTYLTSISSLDVTNALGYTPVTNARVLTINGTAFDLSANRSWTISAGTTLNGTGFVKASGTTISYDNSTYFPTSGGTITGNVTISKASPYLILTNTTTGTSGQIYQSGNDFFIQNPSTGWLYLGNSTNTYVYGNFYVTGAITEASALRYKKDIKVIESGLDKVLKMRGVSYVKKDNEQKEIGVIAEEMNEIMPDVVNKNKEGQVESVSYSRLTAVLIEAVKEQQKQIEELKSLLGK
jgi:hypothetical protein